MTLRFATDRSQDLSSYETAPQPNHEPVGSELRAHVCRAPHSRLRPELTRPVRLEYDREVPTGKRVTLRRTSGEVCDRHGGPEATSRCPKSPENAQDQFLRCALGDDLESSALEISEPQLGASRPHFG